VRVSVTSVLRRYAAAVTIFFVAASPGAALAAGHKTKTKPPTRAEINAALHASRDLWATINICDTAVHPNAIGVRGSMPGTGQPGDMYMRFRVQYYTAADKTWHFIDQGGDSGWVKVGSAKYRTRQSGYTFTFQPPAGGGFWTMRGVVSYQWRSGSKVLFQARKNTVHGHKDAVGGDPAGTSLGLCTIS
jgi:hypothetical protein